MYSDLYQNTIQGIVLGPTVPPIFGGYAKVGNIAYMSATSTSPVTLVSGFVIVINGSVLLG